MSTDEPDTTEDTEPTAEETEATAAEAAGAGADAPEADVEPTPEAESEEAPPQDAPKPRRRRRKAAEPVAEEAPAEPEAEEPEAEEPEAEAAQDDEDEEEAAVPAPAPSRRRARRDPDLPPPTVRAQAKYVRSSARKARLVCDNIRGKSVDEARAILALTPRAIARDWSKLLESAVANAEHNHELVGEDLYVKAVHADEGPTIKRFRPRAMGRATRIRKRTSHLTILLTPKD
jgi:ribosomal protein L22